MLFVQQISVSPTNSMLHFHTHIILTGSIDTFGTRKKYSTKENLHKLLDPIAKLNFECCIICLRNTSLLL